MSAASENDPGILYALACLKTGLVLEVLQQCASPANGKLADFAAAAPELLREDSTVALTPVFARLGSTANVESFREIVLISPHGAQALLRIAYRPDAVVLALCDELNKLGLMLSGLRKRAQAKAGPA
jgi:hypothetical protein